MGLKPPVAEPEAPARTRRPISELLADEAKAIAYHEEKIMSANLRIGKLRDRELAASKRQVHKELASQLDEAVSKLSPGKVLELLQQAQDAVSS
jgi:hypothetical protein